MRNVTRQRVGRGGFTLVELLVVIAIIGILAALLVPTIYNAVIAARNAAIAIELNDLARAVEAYKLKVGDYPPDFADYRAFITIAGDSPAVAWNKSVAKRHVLKSFPRNQDNFQPVADQLDNSEALVFWLSRLKKSVEHPLPSAANQNADDEIFFDFDETRLVDFDGDGFPSYVPKYGKALPFVFFDSRTYENEGTVTSFSVSAAASGIAAPYRTWDNDPKYQPPSPAGPAKWNPPVKKFEDANTYQIICAGLDEHYGSVALPADFEDKRLPNSANLNGVRMSQEDWDNITSFSEKPLEDTMP